MKKVAGVLLASLMLMPISPVYASDTTTSGTTESAASKTVVLPQLYQLNYADIEKVISERNLTVKANMEALESYNNGYLSIDENRADISSTVGSLTRQIKILRAQENAEGITPEQKAAIEVQIKSCQASIASLGNSIAKLENSSEDAEKQVEQAKVNYEMVDQQLYLRAQNLFFSKDALDITQKELEDNIAYLAKKSDSIKLQKTLGMVSDLDVSTLDQQIKNQNYQLDMIKQQEDTIRGQVNLMIGQDFNHPLDLVSDYTVDESNVQALDYPKDLTTVINKSYAIKLKKMEIDAKKLALEHSEEMDGIESYSYKQAQADIETATTQLDDLNKSIKQQFDQAYKDVQDKLQALELEQANLENEKTKFNNAQVGYKVGTISSLDLNGIQVEYNSEVLKAQNAKDDLMKAYTTYQWLLKGVSASS